MTELFDGKLESYVDHIIELYEHIITLINMKAESENEPGQESYIDLLITPNFDMEQLDELRSLIVYVSKNIGVDVLSDYIEEVENDPLEHEGPRLRLYITNEIEKLDK